MTQKRIEGMTLRQLLHIPATTDKPLIAVPLMLGPTGKLTPFAQKLQAQNPDIVEWRADYIADDFSQAVMWQQVKAGAQAELNQKNVSTMTEAKMLAEIDNAKQEFLANWPMMNQQVIKELTAAVFNSVGEFPVLLTYRTQSQGGKGEMSPVEVATFLTFALQSGYPFAAVDIEYTMPEELRAKVITTARQQQVPVILSYHDMNQTPDDLHAQLLDMAKPDIDIIKLAVMPQNANDVDRLLLATRAFSESQDKPLITMSMGQLGEKTRIIGYQFGSELTFAALDGTPISAPGQISISELLQAWQ